MKPREANSEKKLMRLKCDTKAFGKTDILVSERTVSIWPESKESVGWIVLSKKDFNRMIDWYNRDQKTPK